MRAAILTAVMVLCGACRRDARHPTPDARPTARVDGAVPRSSDAAVAPPVGGHLLDGLYYVEPGAPDPLACQTTRDCQGDTVSDASGCCVASPTPRPQSRAWAAWLM